MKYNPQAFQEIFNFYNPEDDQRIDLLIRGVISFVVFFGFLLFSLAFILIFSLRTFPYSEALLLLFYFAYFIAFGIAYRRAKRAITWKCLFLYNCFLIALSMLNAAFRFLSPGNPSVFFVFIILFSISLLGIRKQIYFASGNISSAREKNWLKGNLDESNWTWHESLKNPPRLKSKGEIQKYNQWVNRIFKLLPLTHVFVKLIIKDVSLTGIVLVILASYALSSVLIEPLGFIHQFREWEKEKGQPLLLKEVFESKDPATKKENELNIY